VGAFGCHLRRGSVLDGGEQFAGLVAEALHGSGVWLVAACHHPGLKLLSSKTAVARYHGGGYGLDSDVEVLARRARPQAHVGLLRLAERLDDTCRIAQQGAELRRRPIIEVRYSHDVLAGPDDQGAEIHRAHDMIHRPGRGLVNNASGRDPPAGKQITSEASDDVHARQDLRPPRTLARAFLRELVLDRTPSGGRGLHLVCVDIARAFPAIWRRGSAGPMMHA
jgi:hypothetical protein